ncbi:MAG: 3-oxoacyl-[acyl-carrier-protein] reductase [Candidatus Methylomirabilales bacterium]
MSLEGRVAIVTGGSRGIGAAVAASLARAGAKVVIVARDLPRADATAAALRADGATVVAMKADVAVGAEVEALVDETLGTFGRIDVLVNNAGMTRDGLLIRMKDEDWDRVIEVNLRGAFLCTRAVLRPMIKQRSGRIVNVTSLVGVRGNAGQANYAAAKAGLIGLTKATALEVASRGITINAVAPGFVETDMTSPLSTEIRNGILGQIPLKRFGTPSEIAAAVQYLVSEPAGYVTGQVIHVSGGLWM